MNKKKISILALHLGFGGVEQVICNTANMLCDDFDVEIISLYKKNEEIPFKINDKVKIKYLMNTCSNKEEFKTAVKNKNIINIFKEGFKSVYILLNKNRLIKKEVNKTDAKIIISTRYSFSEILNKCKKNNRIFIHEEHTYSTSDDYINKLKELNNINYIKPCSKVLYETYLENGINNLFYIPLGLNYYPNEKETSKLNTKNLIAVGRLEPEKGYLDLIEVVNELVKKDKVIKLNIFGSGSEEEKINNLIKTYKLENNIKLWGFQTQDFIKKYMKDSSLYVMTSFEESFGLVLIEAMSYKIPCIAFDSAKGARYTIINNKNGYIIKNRNIKEMSNKILEYLKLDEKEKLNMGAFARNSISIYKYDNVKEELIKFYKNIQ